jgi:MFS family permease
MIQSNDEDGNMKHLLNKYQLFLLFAASFTILFVGMGLFPLLPLLTAQFGATKTITGLFLATIYLANASGSLLAGWIPSHISLKRVFILGGLVGIPVLFLLGQASHLWQFTTLAAMLWFLGGLDLALIKVFTSKASHDKRQGRSFSLVSLSIPLGSLVGGAVIGQLVPRLGFGTTLFGTLSLFWSILPLLGLMVLDVNTDRERMPVSSKPVAQTPRLGKPFFLLMGLSVLAAIAISISRVGAPFSMHSLSFSAGQIASSATISGLVTIPALILMGSLSDRFGHRQVLMLGYLLAGGGALLLITASQLWQFWLASSLMLISFCSNGAIASAVAVEVLPASALSRGLSWMNSTNSLAGIMSFAITGIALDTFGPLPLFTSAAVFAVAASILVQILPGGLLARFSRTDNRNPQLEPCAAVVETG